MNFSYWEQEYVSSNIDFLLVGMGLVGLQTAIQLKTKHPNARVVAVDKATLHTAASTRNAGFACFASISEIRDDLQSQPAENVYGTIRKRYDGIQKLRNTYGDSAIGYQEKGSQEIFTKRNKDELHAAIDSLQAINTILYNELKLDRVFGYTSRCDLPSGIGSVQNNYEGQLNTGKLYNTVYQKAALLGVILYAGIEVLGWQKTTRFEVETEQGILLKTEHIILCTNGFSEMLTSENIVPARGQVIVTEKLDKLPCEGLHFYDKGYYYWRDKDGRILLGGARNLDSRGETTSEFGTNEAILQELKQFMREHITAKEVKIDYTWSGIMAIGKEGEKSPIVKELEPGIVIAARLGGMGVALSAVVAEEAVCLF